MRSDEQKFEASEVELEESLERRLEGYLPRLASHFRDQAQGGARGLEPEDLAQEVAVRALRYRDSFDPQRALWPWLKQLASNVRSDHLRKSARADADVADARRDETTELAATAQRPAAHAAALEAREELAQALAKLSEFERDILLRFHQRGESIASIAGELETPTGTIKSHLHRARRKLAGYEGERHGS